VEPLDPTCSPAEHHDAKKRSNLPSASAIEQAARVCRALGEPARLRLMARLATGERCVTELAEIEGEELSTISQRLRVLRAENVVVRRRTGKHINYALADGHMTDLLAIILAHASEPVQNSSDDSPDAI
jgi:ArsR family transcriptional regulator, lead/cadmium/zinc/bismuth-responsive transcriptional repressor